MICLCNKMQQFFKSNGQFVIIPCQILIILAVTFSTPISMQLIKLLTYVQWIMCGKCKWFNYQDSLCSKQPNSSDGDGNKSQCVWWPCVWPVWGPGSGHQVYIMLIMFTMCPEHEMGQYQWCAWHLLHSMSIIHR